MQTMETTQVAAPQTATSQVAAPPQTEPVDELPSFEEYWESSLMELGFRKNEYGEFVFGDEGGYLPPSTAEPTEYDQREYDRREEGGEPTPQRPAFDPALYRTVVAGMVDRVLQTYGEEVAQDRTLRDAVVAFLSSQPPHALNDASVRLLVLAGLGLKSLRQREYEHYQRQNQLKKDPKSALNLDFRHSAERLAQQLGLNPDELISEYLQEHYRKQGGDRR